MISLAGGIRSIHLHDPFADGHHLRIVPGVDDRRNDVAAEGRADLHELVGVALVVLLIFEVVNPQLRAVGSETAEFLGGDARRKFAPLERGAEEKDVRLVFTDQIHDDLRVRKNRKRLEPRIFRKIDGVAAVAVEGIDALFELVAEQERFGLDAQLSGEFTAFADQFKAHIGDLAAFLFDKNPDVTNFFSHDDAYPRV